MKRFVRAWAVAALAVGVGTGCAGEQEALIVLHSVPLSGDGSAGGCMADTSGNSFLSRGRLDAASGTPYVLVPVLQNNLPSRTASSNNSSVDDSELQLGSTVDAKLRLPSGFGPLVGADGENLSSSFTIPIATDSLGPGDSYAPWVEAIPAEYAVAMNAILDPGEEALVTVDLVFHATRTGNSKGNVGVIDSRTYSFPIVVCDGCMVISCECNSADQCVAGTELFATSCTGSAQDLYGDPFDCSQVASDPLGSSGGDVSTGEVPAGSTSDASTGDASSSTGA